MIDPQARVLAASRFHPIHPPLEGAFFCGFAVGPERLEQRLAVWGFPLTGAKQVFELAAAHRVMNPFHVEPDVE